MMVEEARTTVPPNATTRAHFLNSKDSKQSVQLIGLLMWRAGLLLAAATGLYRTAILLLQFIDLPLQIEVGLGLIFSGGVLFVTSLVVERISDAKTEGDLNQ